MEVGFLVGEEVKLDDTAAIGGTEEVAIGESSRLANLVVRPATSSERWSPETIRRSPYPILARQTCAGEISEWLQDTLITGRQLARWVDDGTD
ncbi:MAG: hypothetical protein N2652_02240 [Kiritimatiellae bacterium]|nr:hypothetical protein [Kiritimatiellia bacterium]